MRDLWGRIASTGGTRIYSALVGIFTLTVTARYLGPEGRGQVAGITTWVAMFATLGSMSLGQIAIHRAGHWGPDKAAWQREAASVLGALVLVVTAAAFALAALLHGAVSLFGEVELVWLLLGFAALPLLLWEQYGGSILMALEELRVLNRAQVLGRTLTAALVGVLVGFAGFGVAGALAATLLGQLLVSAWIFVRLLPAVTAPRLPSSAQIAAYVRDGLKLHLNAVGAFLMAGMDVLMVNHFRGPAETGLYQLGTQLTTMMLIVPQAASMVIYGKIAQKGPDGAWPEHRRLLWQVIALMAVTGVVAALTAPWWLPWAAGEAFAPAVDVFRWQLAGTIGTSFSIVMAAQWIGRGYFWQASTLTLLVGGAAFAANSLLIPRHGMYGAAWAALACSLFAILGNGVMYRLCEKARQPG
jgi:O-antigen/teichoic acid export membrane protein